MELDHQTSKSRVKVLYLNTDKLECISVWYFEVQDATSKNSLELDVKFQQHYNDSLHSVQITMVSNAWSMKMM